MFNRTACAAIVLECSLLVACSGGADSSTADSTDDITGITYDRQTVYGEVRHTADAPQDLLSSNVTDQRLVNAVGWMFKSGAPTFYISAIRSDHHVESGPTGKKAHAGGFALDMYAGQKGGAGATKADMENLVRLADQNPYVVEIGLGGAYKTYRSRITHKLYFADNNQTHIHIGVLQAYGSGKLIPTEDTNTEEDPNSSNPPLPPPRPNDPSGDDPDSGSDQQPPDTSTGDTGDTCYSPTLDDDMPEGSCVQSESNSVWYQCHTGSWLRGVDPDAETGPVGPCESMYPL
jgi:hypothetical protein